MSLLLTGSVVKKEIFFLLDLTKQTTLKTALKLNDDNKNIIDKLNHTNALSVLDYNVISGCCM